MSGFLACKNEEKKKCKPFGFSSRKYTEQKKFKLCHDLINFYHVMQFDTLKRSPSTRRRIGKGVTHTMWMSIKMIKNKHKYI